MRVADFDYDLPQELIAQTPAERRDGSKMLTLKRVSGSYELHPFTDIVNYFKPGDCLVLNETRVIPARLWGHRPTGGRVEAFMLEATKDGCWKADSSVRGTICFASSEKVMMLRYAVSSAYGSCRRVDTSICTPFFTASMGSPYMEPDVSKRR